MKINPLIRAYVNDDKVLLENLFTNRTFEINPDVLLVLNSIQNYKNTKDKNVLEILHSLKENHVTIDDKLYNKIVKSYFDWEKYGWWISLLYYLSTENITVLDKNNSDNQDNIIKNYLKKEQPTFYKKYNKSQIKLNYQKTVKPTNLYQLLTKRRTFRDFKENIDIKELSNILYHSCIDLVNLRNLQIKEFKKNPKVLLKSLYSPFEIYLVINNVTGLEAGIYHLDLTNWSLDIIKLGDFRKKIVDIAQGQVFIANSSVVVLISAVFNRYMFRYRQSRAYRDILTTAAELAQQIIIYSTYFQVKTFETPALKDQDLEKLLELDAWKEEVLYLLALGR